MTIYIPKFLTNIHIGSSGIIAQFEGFSELVIIDNIMVSQGASNIDEKLWSKFPFLADKVEKAADSNKVGTKYDIYTISRISNLH